MRKEITDESIESFLVNDVHKRAYREYVKKQRNDVVQAEKLQNFLRQLKNATLQNSTVKTGKITWDNIIDDVMLQELLEEVDVQLKQDNLSTGINRLFQRYGNTSYKTGQYLERELVAIFTAVAKKALENSDISIGEFTLGTGSIQGTTTISKKMQSIIAKTITDEVKNDSTTKINTGTKKNELYQRFVSIKTDVDGLPEISAQTEMNPQWKDIYLLLQGATISAKNYTLHTYNQEEKVWKLKEIFPNIHLGEVKNPYRAIAGTLQDLGYPLKTAERVFYAGYAQIEKGNQEVINHMYHLKYIYELTGAGAWNMLGVGRARFLVFNDPTSDLIYVESAAQLIDDIFDESFNWTGNPLGAIKISTRRFYES